jgi:trigger factor
MPLPYSTPALEGEPPQFKLDADFVYAVKYDVFPKFTVGQYKGLEVELPDVSIADEDVNRELEAVRDRNAVVLDRDDAAVAAKGDVVTVNYSELTGEGAVEAGSEREDFVFTIGTERNIYKFDDDIVGMKKGESKDIEKTYPADFEDKDLAGKTKKIRVTVTNLKEKKLPDLDDDLAQDVDEKFKTLDDLKKNIRERLEHNLEHRLTDVKTNAVLEKIMANTPIDLPESMLRIQLDSQWRNFARQINMDVDKLKESVSQSERGLEEFEQLWRPEAAKALHSRLVVETLIRDLNLTVTEEDKQKEFEHLAKHGGESIEEVKAYYEQENMKEYLESDIQEHKLFDILFAENTIKTGSKESYLELMEKKV